ncbi:NB-ARC domain-containing protein [Lentzea sp. BCCO 10_0061]|uniref:NB-ARC domain-containing protein n=1 Tax=Lentzea sokolovensis TaxID=3095429 RepID=A0ABU4VDC3_9PSEU|nr:NB-ARC domain-containing protein [Lentzea sp. BCCO 10_0061]MDX8148923.1 NB-ARC domain-containing protein [Lentzea sp. BCCO 10_0061]
MSGVVHGTVVQARDVYLQSRAPMALDGLPPVAAEFTGRSADLAVVAAALDGPQPVVVSTGLAGVGKTTLAVKAAHDAAGRFPGGVLFIDLQGYGTRVEPLTALATFLGALGVLRVPESQPEREALYRSQLAKRRPMLVVLDNASSSEQVRPLLPPGDQHRVLVTSRHTLGDLQGARRVEIDVLPADDAVRMLANLLQATDPTDTRIADAPRAAHEIAELCGRLPLALGIVAALLSDDPGLPPTELVVLLREARLAELSYDDLAVRAAFDLSHARLAHEEQRLFRLLSLSPGLQVSTEAAAALAGRSPQSTRKLLTGLRRAHMIESGEPPGWFRFHDLLRLYAAEHCDAEAEEVREAALIRLIDYYVEAAEQAEQQWPGLESRRRAHVWLRAERDSILAVIALAHRTGRREQVLRLAFALGTFLYFFYSRRTAAEGISAYELALDAAVSLGDRKAETKALLGLGRLHREMGHDEAARALFESAAALSRDLDDDESQGEALHKLALLARRRKDFDAAWRLHGAALACFRKGGLRSGEAQVHYSLGVLADTAGLSERAVEYFLDCVEISQAAGRHDLVGHAHKHLALLAWDADQQDEVQRQLHAAHAAYLEGGHERKAEQLWSQFRKARHSRQSRD